MVWSSALIGFVAGGAIAYTVGLRYGERRALRSPAALAMSDAPAPVAETVVDDSSTGAPSDPPSDPPSAAPSSGTDMAEGGDLAAWQLAYYRAVQTEQFKSGFLARTAHELRSPLSSAVGLHQLILSDLCEDQAEEREFIQQANESVLKWVDLLDHLIDVSKVTYGTMSVNLQTISVDKVFDEVSRLVELQAANRNLRLTVNRPEGACLGVADPKRLSQILVDLIEAIIAVLTERAQGGALQLSAQRGEKILLINVDSTCPLEAWQEAIALLDRPDPLLTVTMPNPSREDLLAAIAPPSFTSPTLALRLALLLVQSMGGSLSVRDLQAEGRAGESPLTSRFEITLPTQLP